MDLGVKTICILTLALASLTASASLASDRWSCSGTLTSLTSTLSTRTPQGWVARSSSSLISRAIVSDSERMEPRVLVPSTFLRVVEAIRRADSA